MEAKKILNSKHVSENEIVEMVIWKLPKPTSDRPHGLKYRLAYIVDGIRVIGYDNETGKGDHRHINEEEYSYTFVNVDKLVDDFLKDIKKTKS